MNKYFPFYLYFFLAILCMPIFLSSQRLTLVSATTYTPTVDSSYNVNDVANAIDEDGSYALINSNGYIVFDLGATHGNITEILLKDKFQSSDARLDIYVSDNGASWYQIANEVYRAGASLTWRSYPLSADRNNTRYVKIEQTGVSSTYYQIDDIHYDDTAKVYTMNDGVYPAFKVSHTATIKDGVTSLCGYYDVGVYPPYVIVPKLSIEDEYIDYKMPYSVNATHIYMNHTRLTGYAEIDAYYSADAITWTNLGKSGAGDKNYTSLGYVEVLYLRVLLDGDGEHQIENLYVYGSRVTEEDETEDFFTEGMMQLALFTLGFIMFSVPLGALFYNKSTIKAGTSIKLLMVALLGFMLIVGSVA